MPIYKNNMKFHVVTLFPESFSSYLNESILARAQKNKLIDFKFYNPRDFVKPTKAQTKHDKPYLRVDEKPYGGGPGMLIQAEPMLKALTFIKNKIEKTQKNKVGEKKGAAKNKIKIIHLSPSGKKFTNTYASGVAKKFDHVIIVCGRYEGVDARVKKIFKGDELSIGDYVLTGGELAALVMIDTISRQVKGVLGNHDSVEEMRNASPDVYTRPEILVFNGKKYKVPTVLLSGNHAKIEEWRAKQVKTPKTS
jgi:tRNA (guanine37-N1)-methyltransferase